MLIEVTSLAGYLMQGTGVATLLLSLYYRTSYKDKMPTSLIFSIIGSFILAIYSLLSFQFAMIILNIITMYMSYRGYKLWKGK